MANAAPSETANTPYNRPMTERFSFDQAYRDWCSTAAARGLRRRLQPQAEGVCADFSSNDYLGLARRPELLAAAVTAGKVYGAGATGSRLLSGNAALFARFEARIAADKGTESALIFNSGYQANATALATLLDARVLGAAPLVFADRLNHASLHHAMRLCGLRQLRYHHLDLDHLECLLERHAETPQPKWIVTESVFGMDGDVVDIERLTGLAERYGAWIYLDEAHASGLFGEGGYGLGGGRMPGITMGTFSKAIGASGAYVAGTSAAIDYLVNSCNGFIYSTALSPLAVAAAEAAWRLLPTLETDRQALFDRAKVLRQRLRGMGFDIGQSTTHIIPVILGDEAAALAARDALFARGLVVSAVRPPTVPPGSSRLRIALCANHDDETLDALVDALKPFSPQAAA